MLDEHFNETISDEMSEATLCCDSATSNEFNQRNKSRWRLAYHKLIGSISPEIGKLNYLKLLSVSSKESP
ncbi:hypothetical protein B296_00039252 [Ensete ventricosum]|uniref:Uncharacterized protein n=1 Tax=Ensete ventricosum TaxID=4639 RepID=A0A426ZTX4_ENSVE|nr:hypothetical protein B296_00039252 [Ensete ventricosum]